MHVAVDRKEKSTLVLTIELTPTEMQSMLERAAETLSSEHKISGFRPGKASLGIVIQKLGAQKVWQEAAEHAVRKSYVQAIRQEKIKSIGQPQINITKLAPDNPFVYTATVAVLPEVKIGHYVSLKTKRPTTSVTLAQVDKALDDLRSMFASEALVERPAKTGDKVEVDFDLTADNVLVENGSSKQHPIVIGSNQFIPGFEENLVGLKKEDKKIFDLQFPADYHGKEVAGKKGTFNVTMKSVFEVKKPELDDAFAKRAGKFSTLTELRAELTKNLQAEADREADRKLENDLIDELIHSSSFGDIPEILMESELAKMLHELEEEVERQGGLKFADYLQGIKKTAEELKKEFRPQAERRIKAALLIRAIGEQEKIMVDDAAIDQEVQQTLKMYEQDPSIKERIDSEDYRDYVRTMLTNRKVIELLKTKVAM